ncbi:MAG: GNAT family N-acetyltransferase [Candidatus Syntrophosphaera sp.]|nr:GNAT family N-acetyltransferase [Candidatus Syntrophosphaera sp.]
MAEISYVEYEPRHAKAIADMWNRSAEGWMGRFWNSSEARVLQEQQNSPYLNLYLAVEGTEVIGYARLCAYSEERGVAYIEMLNVLPTRHGQGIGKELVRRCVLRASELGYARIDLFTWPGNLKAMPLYKKCGFFWERMESGTTHLMNFLPGLLNSELLKPHFEWFDWYADFKRELEPTPDGRLDSGFELYDHVWEKEGHRLRVAVEKRGRGIFSLATEDYELQTVPAGSEPVFGLDYPVSYRIRNLSGKPLRLALKGKDDAEVRHSLDFQAEIEGTQEISSRFRIEPIATERSEWESMQGVCCEALINGARLELKTGLKIHFPLDLDLSKELSEYFPARPSTIYLNLQNNFPVSCSFEISFPEQERIKLLESEHRIHLEAGERAILPLPFRPEAACVYAPRVRVKARPEKGREIEFTKQPVIMLPMHGSSDQAVTTERFQLLNGTNSLFVWQDHKRNMAFFQAAGGNNVNLNPPQIGLPYSDEFETEDPLGAEVSALGQANQLRMRFASKHKPGCEFALLYTLYPGGLLEYSLRVLKLPEEEDLKALLQIGLDSTGFTYQSGGRILSLEADQPDRELNDLLPLDPDANWVFAGSENSSVAMIWPPGEKVRINRWWLAWELDLKEVAGREDQTAGPFRIFLDAFPNALQVRNLALNQHLPAEPIHPTLELVVDGGNPCVGETCEAVLTLRQDQVLAGKICLKDSSGAVLGLTELARPDENRECKFILSLTSKPTLEKLSCELNQPLYSSLREQVILHSRGELKQKTMPSSPSGLISLDNGCLQFSAAKEACLPSLISLTQAGREWLASGYPDFAPRGSYNPFLGGLSVRPGQISLIDLQAERHQAGFSRLRDNWGNLWEGIAITTSIGKFKPLQGLVYRQHYLSRPGLPLLVAQVEIVSAYGRADYAHFPLYAFFAPEGGLSSGFVEIPGEDGAWQRIYAGRDRFYFRKDVSHTRSGSDTWDEVLHILSSRKTYRFFQATTDVLAQGTYVYSRLLNKVPQFLPPLFLVWGDRSWRHDAFSQLLALRFGAE